ncbi:unnamed protein product [Brugia pahangi]|uniref:Ovule protein n=1 Tax=Brugia pahangi TaxID=6280 RepID=A0A0N4TP28_BRUPA|nr:unnamed protein product [Brugia pahangi]
MISYDMKGQDFRLSIISSVTKFIPSYYWQSLMRLNDDDNLLRKRNCLQPGHHSKCVPSRRQTDIRI